MAYQVCPPPSNDASLKPIFSTGMGPFSAGRRRGFSLIEVLFTITIISVLTVLVSIAFQSILGSAFDSEVSDLANLLVRARVYAMANNTYAYVGIRETNASLSAATIPQTAGSGRLGVTIMASVDGTRGYPATAPTALAASGLIVVSPLRNFENIHLLATSGIAQLPNAGVGSTFNIYGTNSLTTFQWPLTGTAQYSFGATPGTVIQFNPQGEAQIMPTGTTNDSLLQWIEIDLEPTNAQNLPAVAINTASILVSGSSGAVTFYRP